MYTLGINAAFHDSSACLVKDGLVLAAAEEERFTGIKHGKRPVPFSAYELPFHAIDYCLGEAGIDLTGVDHIAYAFDPDDFSSHHQAGAISLPVEAPGGPSLAEGESIWDPLFALYTAQASQQLADGVPHHLQGRFRKAGAGRPYQWHYVAHHLAHAASAFLVSPFEEAAVMTIDGRGERASTCYYAGRSYDLDLLGQVDVPHSLGLLYERLTTHLGFLHSSDEYKVMALASYGKPRYIGAFRDLIVLEEEGRYRIKDIPLTSILGPPRRRGAPFTQDHFDMAHSLQVILEDTVLQLITWLHEKTRLDYLCLAGGVALNCVMNARLRDRGPFKEIWVQPAAGDAGTALGAAVWTDIAERRPWLPPQRPYVMDHAYLGPQYTEETIEYFLRWAKVPFRRMEDIAGETADLLVKGKIIGWFQGRMEFGPRALGARSIIASPLHADMQARLNDIKDREDFRPVAPAVMEEKAAEWFKDARISPFMLFVYDVLPQKSGLIPAVCHVDGTARIQTVRPDQHPLYYDLLGAFNRKTGVPVLINTSFNTRGKPIVCSPQDALECFWTSPLDALVIGPFVVQKEKLS